MSRVVQLCAVCAWRKECKKKFSYPDGIALNCPDFVRDVTLPVQEGETEPSAGKEASGAP